MGTNNEDYLNEAHYILRPGTGQLWLAETAARIGTDKERIKRALAERGFDAFPFEVVRDGKFVVLGARRSLRTAEVVSGPLLARESVEMFA